MSMTSHASKRLSKLYRAVLQHMRELQWLMDRGLRHLVEGNARPMAATVEQFEPRLLMNAAPVIGLLAVDPQEQPGHAAVTVDYTDADTADTHTATIDWGDQSTSTLDVTEADGSGLATGSHAYATNGVHHAILTLSDSYGNAVQSNVDEVVDNAESNAGFTYNLDLSSADSTGLSGWQIDWGDGNDPQAISVTDENLNNIAHEYADATPYTISVTGIPTDDEGLSGDEGATNRNSMNDHGLEMNTQTPAQTIDPIVDFGATAVTDSLVLCRYSIDG